MGRPKNSQQCADAATVPAATSQSKVPKCAPSRASRRLSSLRRSRAYAVSGGLLTMTGLGLLGATVGVVGVELQRAADMRGMIAAARAEQRKFTTAEDQRFDALAEDLLRGRGVAIGIGVAAVATLAAGVAVLVTRRRWMRGYALLPHGGPQSVGAHFRLRF